MTSLRSLLALIMLAPAVAAPAQQLLIPQTVRFDGTQEYTPAELGTFVGINKGSTYTSDYLAQTAQKLMAVGTFDKVSYKFDGIDLIYQVHDNPDLYAVEIQNLPIGADFDAQLRQRVPLYHGKVPSEGDLLESVRSTLEAMVAAQGVSTKVSYVPAGDSPYKKATSIKFHIELPPIKAGEVRLAGVSDTLQPDIAKAARMGDAEFDFSLSPKFIAERIRDAYIRSGYPTATVTVRAEKPISSDTDVRVPFTAEVVEGRAWKLGAVHMAPTVPLDAAQIEKVLGPREKYTPESTYVGAYVGMVQGALHRKGYLDGKVVAQPALDDASGVVNYTIDATTGGQYRLGLLKFDNVSDQLRSVLMRNWQMMPGDPFDDVYLSSFILTAQKSDPALQRTLAGVKTVFDVHADPNTHEVNVVIRLERIH